MARMAAPLAGCLALLALVAPSAIRAQPARDRVPPSPDVASWAAGLASNYWISANVTYHTVERTDLSLDVYAPRNATGESRVPAVIFFHGGGWTGGDKIVGGLRLLPYLEMGWA